MPSYWVETEAKVTASAGTEKSLIEFALPATRRVQLTRLMVTGYVATAGEPASLISLSYWDTAAAGGTGITPVKNDVNETATLTTGHTRNRTAMPTNNRVQIIPRRPINPGQVMLDLDLMEYFKGEYVYVPVSKIVCASVTPDAAGTATVDWWAMVAWNE